MTARREHSKFELDIAGCMDAKRVGTNSCYSTVRALSRSLRLGCAFAMICARAAAPFHHVREQMLTLLC